MKLVIASDIHGSYYYLKKLVDFFEQSGAEKLLLLGDLLYHGARNALPKEYDTIKCTALYNQIKDKVVCMRGNCDSEVDQMVLDFPIQAEYALLPYGNRLFYLTHGHKTPACLKKEDVLFNGHFHVPAFEQKEEYFYVNCGSVSIPKENSPHSCILFEDGTLSFIDLESGNSYRIEKI